MANNPYTHPNENPRSLLPNNRKPFEAAVEGAFQYNIYPVEDGHIFDPVLTAWDPDKIPESFIPYLGQNLGLEIDDTLTEAQKRMLLRCAWNLHQYAGTPHVLLEIVRALGYSGVGIEEGESIVGAGITPHWANFQITVNDENIRETDGRVMAALFESLKPTRSVLVGINITTHTVLWDGASTFDGTETFGGTTTSGIVL